MTDDAIYQWIEAHFGQEIKHFDHGESLRALVAAAEAAAFERAREMFGECSYDESEAATDELIRAMPNPYQPKAGQG